MSPRAEAVGDDRGIFADCLRYVLRNQFAAQTAIQRNVRIGFAKAGRMLATMEEWGIVGPADGSRARAVLVPPEQLEALLLEAEGGDTTP